MKSLTKIIFVAFIFMIGQAQAHHSSVMFDDKKTIELSGTVKEFQWKNPHVWIQVMVKVADGTTKEWSVEGGGPNSLSRDGWRPTTFRPGEAVTLKVHPMRDGSAAGNFIGAKWADGRTLGAWQ
jgi:hypothetical protein